MSQRDAREHCLRRVFHTLLRRQGAEFYTSHGQGD